MSVCGRYLLLVARMKPVDIRRALGSDEVLGPGGPVARVGLSCDTRVLTCRRVVAVPMRVALIVTVGVYAWVTETGR